MQLKNMNLRLAMWSGPRNISTALMRSFENRPDTWVIDEPLYAHYLLRTGLDHPGRDEILDSMENDWEKLTTHLTGPIPENKTVWYQKHMTHHYCFDYNDDWLENVTNCFLIRQPEEVIVSFLQRFRLEDWEQIGFPQQIRIFHRIMEKTGRIPIVIDSNDILKDPEKILTHLCSELNIPFMDQMLKWPEGTRDTDGIWGKHWYGNVVKTTGFAPYKERNAVVPTEYHKILEKCIPIYEELSEFKIRL